MGVSGATISDGVITHADGHSVSYGELAATSSDFDAQVDGYVDRESALTPHEEWKVLGQGAVKANGREVATGGHRYPSDIQRPNMLYGKILRPPSYGAELIGVDLDAVKELADVTAVHDGNFVGCMAPTSYQAQDGIDALSVSAQWRETTHPSSTDLARVLKENTPSSSHGHLWKSQLYRKHSKRSSNGSTTWTSLNENQLIRLLAGLNRGPFRRSSDGRI